MVESDRNERAIMASREKYWDELTDAERIQRLRDVVVNLSQENARMSRALVRLHVHRHGESGELLAPLYREDVNEPIGYAYDRTHGLKTQRERER